MTMTNPALRQAFDVEMTAAIALYEAGKFVQAFPHLEIAHVLGQRYVVPHVATHYWMLRIGNEAPFAAGSARAGHAYPVGCPRVGSRDRPGWQYWWHEYQ